MEFKKLKLNREGATRLGKKARDMWNENWDRIEGSIGGLDDYLNDWFTKVEQTLADFKAWMLNKAKDQDERIDNLVINADGTNNAEMIDARQSSIDGTFHATVRARLKYDFELVRKEIENGENDFKNQNFKRLPISEVFSIEHNQKCYPVVRVLAFENGLGIGPLGVNLGGSNTTTVNCDVEYMGRNNLKVKVPLSFAMTNPITERISANEYLLVEGIKSLIIEVGTKAEANVETFVTREILSDFNTPPKISNSLLENKNDFRYGLSAATSVQLPTAVWGAGEQVHINGIKSLDGVSANLSRLGVGMIGQWLTKYDAIWILEQIFPTIFKNAVTTASKVAIAKKVITKFQYKVWAKASGPTNTLCSHSLYNPTSNSWGASTTSSEANITQRIITSNNASTPAYLTSDGFYYFVTYAEASDGTKASSVSTDYSSITITARVPFSKI